MTTSTTSLRTRLLDSIETCGGLLANREEKILRKLRPLVERANAFEEQVRALTDDELRETAARGRERVADGETLEELLPEVFACAREASRRAIGLRPFDVQLLGGAALNRGHITEMATGEGKTLVATLPAVLNAMTGRGVYVVTVNDYLAQRDEEWMRPVYAALGLRSASLSSSMEGAERAHAYQADIVYGSNDQFGFDHLRDNMRHHVNEQVQRDLHFALIDEVDSVLIDEARTPLIISGRPEAPNDLYRRADRVARALEVGRDFTVKEKERQCVMTDTGIANAERLAGVGSFYDGDRTEWPHHLEQALRAHHLYHREKDYVVAADRDGSAGVIIIDESTGRMSPGRRWSDGLHQAIEAKERLEVRREQQVQATITYQNYFRQFEKVAGMTGTAKTEAEEFRSIYGLEVVRIPTHRPNVRVDHEDVVHLTERDKIASAVLEIVDAHEVQRPVLVGTGSIEKSERLSGWLSDPTHLARYAADTEDRVEPCRALGKSEEAAFHLDRLERITRAKVRVAAGLRHEVLNARHHEREAQIVAQAGREGAITIATNMAGRGTDIVLGDSPDEHERIVARGGLLVIGTDRHESRRIDNQLRGRAARQGEPGATRFYLSLEDDLLRVFANDWVSGMLRRLGMVPGQEIASRMVTRGIERAQRRVEAWHFEARKSLVKFDSIVDRQRRRIYGLRQSVVEGDGLRDRLLEMIDGVVARAGDELASDDPSPGDVDAFAAELARHFDAPIDPRPLAASSDPRRAARGEIEALYRAKEDALGEAVTREVERHLMLTTVDQKWIEHLDTMSVLRDSVQLRPFAQADPWMEFHRDGFEQFERLWIDIEETITRLAFRVQEPRPEVEAPVIEVAAKPVKPVRPAKAQVGRNEPCPCGSGRKSKKCCGVRG